MQIRIDPGRPGDLEGQILRVLRGRLDVAFRQAAPAVRARIGAACDLLIEGSSEYESLVNGELLWELGIPNPEARLRQVLKVIRDGIEVRALPVRISGQRLVGGMTAGLLRSDFEDVLGLSASSYVSAPSGSPIDWLDWLLTQGDRVVVYGYDVNFDLSSAQRSRSRTGHALMTPGQGWRVPPEFSGTLGDNFLVRALDVPAAEALIARAFQEEITRRL